MLIRLFRSTQIFPVAVLILVSIAISLISWSLHYSVVAPNGMPLYDLISGFFMNFEASGGAKSTVLSAVIVFILITSQALHLNFVLNKHEVFFKQSWLPSLIYLIVASIIPQFIWFSPLLFVNSILIFALDKIFGLYKNSGALALAFDSAFLLSLSALFYLPAIVFVIVYIVSILILRPFSWRDWLVGIMGFTLPFFFAFLYYFLTDKLNAFYDKVFISGINKTIALQHLFTYQYTFSLFWIAVLFCLALFRLQKNYFKNVTKSRLTQQILLILIPVAVILVLVSREESLYRFCVLAVPFSAYVSYYFLSGKKIWLLEIMLLVLVGGWVYNYFIA
jgi:hypothetical protein